MRFVSLQKNKKIFEIFDIRISFWVGFFICAYQNFAWVCEIFNGSDCEKINKEKV